MKKYLPNTITLLNLFCGCCAVVALMQGQVVLVFWLVAAGIAADYLDGFIARLLKVHSELGKELDSLADLVTFGLVPGAIFYYLLNAGYGGMSGKGFNWWAAPGFLVTVFSALRLAKFNLDERQTNDFLGLPTPSSAIFTIGLLLLFDNNWLGAAQWLSFPPLLYGIIAILCTLLVAEIPMFSLKFKGSQWRGNEIRYIFLGLMFIFVLFLREAAFSAIILLYVLVSVFRKIR